MDFTKWLLMALSMGVSTGALAQNAPAPAGDRWFITAKRIYVSPDEPPVDNAWLVIRDGKIESLGRGAQLKGVRHDIACGGGVVVAGFQNSHVHFTDPAFIATRPVADLERAVRDMLTSRGFTTVVDTGSDIANTVALRERIQRGEVRGPAILTSGLPLYPQNGIPFYLRDMPPEILRLLPQPGTAEEGIAVVGRNFALGANVTKLFVATPQGGTQIKRMSAEVARAAAEETHRRGGLVMAHPTDPQGVQDAVNAGVDILTHTTIDPFPSTWSDALIRDMVSRRVSVVPTLKLWGYELDKFKAPPIAHEGANADARAQLVAFARAGGQVLFGTDVGYMTDLDPTAEYVLMAQAGLTPMQILASLTTASAARWKDDARRSRVKAGFDADFVVLDGDPAADVRNFSAVKCTIRGGREIFRRDAPSELR